MAERVVYTEHGGPEVLRVEQIAEPEAGPGEVVVTIQSAGVNPIDHKLRSGARPSPPLNGPRSIGADGAGVLAAVGPGVSGLSVGDPVAIHHTRGTYATALAVPAEHVVLRPAGVSADQGAALGIPAGTAYQSVRSLEVGPGDTLVVHGASGAVGQAATQFAVRTGAVVIGTASPARHALVQALGALPVAHGPGLAARIRELAPDGVTVAYDAVGTDEAIEVSLDLVADRSRIATIVRGQEAAGWGIRAFSGGSPTPLTEQELRWRAEALPLAMALIAAAEFSVEIGPRYPLAAAAEAHRALEAGAVRGKVIIDPTSTP